MISDQLLKSIYNKACLVLISIGILLHFTEHARAQTQQSSIEKNKSSTALVSDGFVPVGKIEVSVVSLQKAKELMKSFKQDSRMPFDYGFNGCKERSQIMTSLAAQQGVELGKVFVTGEMYADNSASKLSPKMSKDVYIWKKHVAPMVYVEEEGEKKLMILDPAMSEVPMTVEEFKTKLAHTSKNGKLDQTGTSAPRIDRLYYGSRFQYESYEDYPAKVPPMNMTQYDHMALASLEMIDISDVPDSDEYALTEVEYCEKYGHFCKDKIKGSEIQKLREKKYNQRFAKIRACDIPIHPVIKNGQVELPNGFSDNSTIPTSILTQQQMDQLFLSFKNNSKIDYSVYVSSSYRTHLMLESAKKQGVVVAKAFFEGSMNLADYRTKDKNGEDLIQSSYDAVIVLSKDIKGQLKTFILDPYLFDKPVELETFKKRLLRPRAYLFSPPEIQTFYCGSAYQLEPYSENSSLMPVHDMSGLYDRLIKRKFEEYKTVIPATSASRKKSNNIK